MVRRIRNVHVPASLVAALLMLITGCGRGQSPTDTTSADGKQLTVASLRTSQPITGAVAQTEMGITVLTDIGGVAALSDLSAGGAVSVEAADHFGPYRFIYRPGTTLRMIPADANMPASWVREALYASNDFSCLFRPEPGVMTIVPSADMYTSADEFTRQGIDDGVELLNRSHRHIRMVVKREAETGDRVITLRLNPAAPGYGVTHVIIPPGKATIIGADIDFSIVRLPHMNEELQRRHFVRAVAHELAHASGLIGHPPAIPGVNNGGIMWGTEPVQEFSQAELDIMDWEYTLPPGTLPPANTIKLAVTAKTSGKPIRYMVCALGLNGAPAR